MSQEISGAVKVLETAVENDFIRTSFVLQSAKVSVSGYCLLISSRLYLNFKGPLGTHVHRHT